MSIPPKLAPKQLESIAAAAHEAHRQLLRSTEPLREVDHWNLLSFAKRASLVAAVLRVTEGEIATPEDAHAAWCAHMAGHGWKYGEELDNKERTHPCLVNWDLLSEEDRAKDVLFVAIVNAMVEALSTTKAVKEATNA